MRTLVTGAAGFIGSHVASHLLEMDCEVVALDDLSGGYRENVPRGAQWVQGSVGDYPRLARLFRQHSFDAVLHFAAYAAEGLSPFIRRFNYQNNLAGSVNLINLSVLHHVQRFVFASSIAVYGSGQVPMTEDLTPHPEDPYGIAKYAVELDLEAARRQFGLDFLVFRLHNVYGERQNIWDPHRNVIGIFIRQILDGKPLTVFGDGTQTRAFSYIGDVAPVIARSITRSDAVGQVFNLGGDQPCTVSELAHRVSAAMGTEPVVVHLPERLEVKHAYARHEKVRSWFDVPLGIPLEQGLARMAAWARSAGPRPHRSGPVIEVARGLPSGW